MGKHISEFSLDEMNSYLQQKFGIGLHLFTVYLGATFLYLKHADAAALKKRSVTLSKLKKNIIEVLLEAEENVGYLRAQREIDEHYKLKPLFNLIDREVIEDEHRYQKKKLGTPKGAEAKIRNVLATGWELLIVSFQLNSDHT